MTPKTTPSKKVWMALCEGAEILLEDGVPTGIVTKGDTRGDLLREAMEYKYPDYRLENHPDAWAEVSTGELACRVVPRKPAV